MLPLSFDYGLYQVLMVFQASATVVLERSFDAEAHPYFNIGDRVQVMRGPFVGAEGYLLRVAPGRHKLVVAVEWVNHAVSVEIDANDVDRCD